MANETELDLDSQNQAQGVDEVDFSSPDAAKEAYQKLLDDHQKATGSNKQLYARAKKAEGFELVDGKWIKPPKNEPQAPKGTNEPSPSKDTSQPGELDYGQIALLNSMVGLKGKDEIALAREYIAAGKDILGLSENKFFLQDLQTLREGKEHDAAIPKGKGRSAQIATTDIDRAYVKFQETGEWPADYETAKKLKDKIVEAEKGAASIYTKK